MPLQEFIPSEVLASDPTLGLLLDPEYDAERARFCWLGEGQDGYGDETLWIGFIDRATGLFTPSHGKAIAVATGSFVGVTDIGNGPEWSYNTGNPQIVVTGLSGGTTIRDRCIVVATQTKAGWTTEILANTAASYGPIASTTEDDPTPSVAYQKMINPGIPGDLTRAIFARQINDPLTEVMIPFTDVRFTPGARWVVGTDKCVFTQPIGTDITSQRQIYSFDRVTHVYEQLTFDEGSKFAAFMWNAPEFGGELGLMALIDETHLGIYQMQDLDGTGLKWTLWNVINPPAPGTWIWSPEPFVFEGRSYIVMNNSPSSDQQSLDVPTEIWLAGIDRSRGPFYRRINGAIAKVRKDPETVVFAGQPPVTIKSDATDYMLSEAGTTFPTAETMIVGSSNVTPAGGRNAILVFPLPVIGTQYDVRTATLQFVVTLVAGLDAAIHGDVWILGVGTTAPSGVYLEADTDADPTHVKVSENLLTSTTTAGYVTTGATDSQTIGDWLTAWYLANPTYAGGSNLYVRVNPDANMGSTFTRGWAIAAADHPTVDTPTLTLALGESVDVKSASQDYTQYWPKYATLTGSILHVGANGTGPPGYYGRSAVLAFPLPALGYQETIEELILSVVLNTNTPITGLTADVWYLGIGDGNPIYSHLEGRTQVFSSEVLLKTDWLTSSSPINVPIYLGASSCEPARADVLSWYRLNPDYSGTGAYAYFRINPSNNPGSVTGGWFPYSGNVAIEALKPQLRIWKNPRDKPLVYITISGGIYKLDTGLDGPYWGNYDTTFTRT